MYGQEFDNKTLEELQKEITERIAHQKLLRTGKTLYFGTILPIYAYAEKSLSRTKDTGCGIATIYGFEENKLNQIPPLAE